jgi:hypothetical protein
MDETARGAGWLLCAGIMLIVAGTLNIIWGIAAVDNANFFVEGERYIFEDLTTMGWIVLVIGVIQVLAAFSIWPAGSSAAGSGSSPAVSAPSARCSRSPASRCGPCVSS